MGRKLPSEGHHKGYSVTQQDLQGPCGRPRGADATSVCLADADHVLVDGFRAERSHKTREPFLSIDNTLEGHTLEGRYSRGAPFQRHTSPSPNNAYEDDAVSSADASKRVRC